MEPPRDQPFNCHVCNLNFSSGKALGTHMKEKHEPNWTASDRKFLRSIRIKVDDE